MKTMRRIRAIPMTASTRSALLLACLIAWHLLPAVAASAVAAADVAVAIAIAAKASSDDCPANFYSCASQGSQFDGICCPFDQSCSLDTDNRPACCPAGDVCTGSAPTTYVTTTATASYVPNTYFSFPYILPADIAATTALADANACDAVLQQCSQSFSLCTADLEGGGNSGTDSDSNAGSGDGAAITIVISGSTTFTRGGGGGATAAAKNAATTLVAASAAGICSSLRSQACGGLPSNAAGCSSIFSGRAAATGFSTGDGSTRQRRLPSLGQVVAVATAVGVASLVML